MADREVTADTTFREFIDARRNSSAFQDRVDEVQSGQFGVTPERPDGIDLDLLGVVDQGYVWRFGRDTFLLDDDLDGAREEVAKYALYRRKVLKAGGEPSDFERPTKDGWA